jgi:hypothetical protein
MNALRLRIKELAEQHGSVRAAARVLSCDHTYLHRLSTGEKDDPSGPLLRRLGLRRIVHFARVGKPAPLVAELLRPVLDQIRLAWLRFKRDTQDVMSPYLPALLVRINRLEHRNQRRR